MSPVVKSSSAETAAAAVPPVLPDAGREATFAPIRRLFYGYVAPHWAMFLAALACMIATSAASGALPLLVNYAVKHLFLEKHAGMLFLIPAAAIGLMAVRALSGFGQQALIDTVGERVVTQVQRDMFDNLVRRDLASLNAEHSGRFISALLYDALLMRDTVTRGVAALGLESTQLIAYAVVMLYEDWQLTVLAVVVLPPVVWAMERIGGSLRRASQRGMAQTGDLATALAEALDGRRIVKAYGLERHVSERASEHFALRLRTMLKVVRRRAAAIPTTDLFAALVVAATLIYAGYQAQHNALQLNDFVAFLTAMLLALQPIRNLSQLLPVISTGAAAANRVFAVIDTPAKIVDPADARELSVQPAPRGGAVRFDNVRFAYVPGVPSIDGISLSVAPGEKVALVGPSGAGKSTIFNLLLRFYETDAGTIVVDGQNIRRVTLASLRNVMALVTQEAVLFDESVADNIALGRLGASRAEVEQAARDAAADGFIRALPQGYDTRVGEGGLRLSGGQRQRIAIARAMLRDAPILLLDEATSALDAESERQVQAALKRLMQNRTTIVIAHRLSTVLDADRIYVLDNGKAVESGKHAELIAQGGLYSRLYRRDFAAGAELENA